MPEVIETRPICKQQDRYIGWPSVVCAPGGTVHAVFSGDRDGHVCPFGKSFITSSEDGGLTWSEPRLVNDTPFDDRDTGLCVLPDGTLVITWFTSHYYRAYEVIRAGYSGSGTYKSNLRSRSEWEEKIKEATKELDRWTPFINRPTPEDSAKYVEAWKEYGCQASVEYDERFPANTRRLGYWTRRSKDGGLTWDEPTLSPVMAPHGANVLPDGRLVFAGTAAWSGNIGIAFSPDAGLSWRTKASLNEMIERNDGLKARLCEPHVVAAPSGKLVGMARYQAAVSGDERFLWQFDSEDGGLTWTEARPTPMNGYPPHLLRTGDGRLLASFSARHEPLGHRFCFSEDEGRTWKVDEQLHVGTELGDLGYPATAEVAPGSFLSVYYQRDREDEKPCLVMTRWKG